MKTNKVLKWLYGVFMFLPMLAIGVTCAYVTFNKNAKDNYSGETINNYTLDNVNEYTNLQSTNTFELLNNPSNLNPNEYNGATYQLKNVEIIYLSANTTYFTDTCSIRMYHDSTGNKWAVTNNSNQTAYILVSSLTCDIKFNFVNNVTQYSTNFVNQVYERNYNNNYFLDNAFYYAVGQFNESGFNQIDFVSFFNFLYIDTNIWVTFANTYINYTLFVSLCFFLPSVLLWFINFAYKLMDGFSNKSTRL